jgi:dihydrofolate synthase / folylpolyglutamate synthase
MHAVLDKMGAPHKRLSNVIHVVGSKGKGTVTALLASVLRKSGQRVGVYTSPHLVSMGERIVVGTLLLHLQPAHLGISRCASLSID